MGWTSTPTPGGGWEYKHDETEARIILDYLFPVRGGLEAWVELRMPNQEIPVSQGQRNLMVAGAINPFLQDVRDKEDEVPWESGLRLAFYSAIEAWREGSPIVDLTTIDPKGLQFLVDPIIETGGNTRLIAPGGSGKSLFALALEMTVATGSTKFLGLDAAKTGPVLYLDWETNVDTHAQRVQALCGPAKEKVPGRDLLMYSQESMPLARSVVRVDRAVRRMGAVMLVIDSSKMAAGPSGQSSGEESTLSMYQALREIGVPALIVDHKNREDMRRNRTGGYGSVYNENLARMQWEFTSYLPGPPRRFILALTKENNVGPLPPMAFMLTTKGGKTGIIEARFSRIEVSAVLEQSEGADLGNLLFDLLVVEPAPLPIKTILEAIGDRFKEASIKTKLNADPRFTNIEPRKNRAGQWRVADDWIGRPREDGFQVPLEEYDPPPVEEDGILEASMPVSDYRTGDEVW